MQVPGKMAKSFENKSSSKHLLISSASKKGDCYDDNAATESWNHTLKVDG